MTLQGATRTYQFDGLGLNARCRIEELTGRPFVDVLRELGGKRRPRPETARDFVAALLVDPPCASITHASAVLRDIGGLPVIRRAAKASWRTYRSMVKTR